MTRNEMKMDRRLSREVAKKVGVLPNSCYRNSTLALAYLPEGSKYVEGLATIRHLGLPLEHAWCVLSDGKTVVDVSWADAKSPVKYVPVDEWTFEEVFGSLVEKQGLPLLTPLVKSAEDYVSLMKRAMWENDDVPELWDDEK